MQQPSIGTRIGSMLLLIAAIVAGLESYAFMLGLAFGGAFPELFAIVAGKAVLAGVGGYLSERPLRMSRGSRLTLLGAYEIGPVLTLLFGIGNLGADGAAGFQPLLWFVFAIPDVAAGCLGIALGRSVDTYVSARRSAKRCT
jgi:hypothetical protein